jgi:hypothetical protein
MNIKDIIKQNSEQFDKEIPLRTINNDNPQYVLGWNACRYLCEKFAKQEREKILNSQWEMMMECLPKDAENLSTLIPDQALRLMKCFIAKQPWD